MYIIIVGITTLGRKLADALEEEHDVIIVEESEDKSERLYAETGAEIINANPASLSALEDAEIQRADVLVSTLEDDNKNVVVCSLAKKFDVDKVVSKVSDTDYIEAFQVVGAETVEHSNVLFSEFRSKIEHPYLVKVADLDNRLELFRAKVVEGSSVLGLKLSDLTGSETFPSDFEPAAVLRDGSSYTDDIQFKLEEGDSILMVGPSSQRDRLSSFFESVSKRS